jgi:hypothetical protein
MTRGTPASLVERLESLSGYRPLFPASSPQASRNPVSWAHWRISAGGQAYSVLSRVCFAGLDYTQRSNKFAHHVALTGAEQTAAGPAWVLLNGNIARTNWPGESAEIPTAPVLPRLDAPAAICSSWAHACGDAGWAGALVDLYLNSPAKPVYIICPADLEMLPLMCEAIALLPASQRWQVTFNTYHTDLPAGTPCLWRCCVAGSSAVEEAHRSGANLIDLTQPLAPAADSKMVRLARTGQPELSESPAAGFAESPALLDHGGDDDLEPLPAIRELRTPARTNLTRPAAFPQAPVDVYAMAGESAPEPAGYRRVAPPMAASAPAAPQRSIMMPVVAAAVISSAIVGVGVWMFVQSQATADIQRARAETTDAKAQIAAADEKYAKLSEDFKASEQSQSDLEARLKEAKEQLDKPRTIVTDLIPHVGDAENSEMSLKLEKSRRLALAAEERNRALQAQVDSLSIDLASARKDLAAARTQNASSNDQPKLASWSLADIQDSTAAQDIPMGDAPSGTSPIRFALSTSARDSDGWSFDPDAAELSAPTGSGVGNRTICSFAVKSGKVIMHWPALTDDTDQARKKYLQNRMLTVGDPAHPGLFQFAKRTEIAFNMIAMPSADLPAVESVAYSVEYSSTMPVQSSGLDGKSASFVAPGGSLVKISFEGSKLLCNFHELYSSKTADYNEKSAAWESTVKSLPKKGDPDTLTQTRAAAEQKSQDLLTARKALDDMIDPAKVLPITAIVRGKNGVEYYRIKLTVN